MKTSQALNRMLFFAFTLSFFSEVLFLSTHIETLVKAPALFWVLAGFATLRLAHTISYNGIGEWLRFLFVAVVPDSAGGSEGHEPKEGPFNVIGQLLCCPICSGTWSAMFLITVYALFPPLGWAFISILGLAGISEMLHWTSQPLEWSGRYFRELAGSEWLWKNKGVVKPHPHTALFSPETFKERVN
jgi:hypothetical protein